MVSTFVSNKPDGKERRMNEGKSKTTGRFLAEPKCRPVRRRTGRWMMAAVLLAWDGVLLYMIVRCLIEPVYGGVFIAVVSVYLGYHLN